MLYIPLMEGRTFVGRSFLSSTMEESRITFAVLPVLEFIHIYISELVDSM